MNLSPLPIQKFFDNAGRPLNGGLLFTYVASTTTKIATYTDSTGGSPNTNPVVLNFRGEANVWLDQTLTYKFVLAPEGDTDPPTRPIWSVDNISASVTFASLTQQIIGQILYPRTVAEIAASVLPVNYAYPECNAFRYGATGDGATDDTAALQNMLSVLAQTSVRNDAVLPIGSYVHISTLTVPASRTLLGTNFASILKPSAAVAKALVQTSGSTVDGITIDGTATSGKIGLSIGDEGSAVNNGFTRNVYVFNFTGSTGKGVYFNQAIGWRFDNIYLDSNHDGLIVGGGVASFPTNSDFYKVISKNNGRWGIAIFSGYSLLFAGGDFEINQETGTYIDETIGIADFVDDVTFLNCWWEQNWQSLASGAPRHAQFDCIVSKSNRVRHLNCYFSSSTGTPKSINWASTAKGAVLDNCYTGPGVAGMFQADSGSQGCVVNWPESLGSIDSVFVDNSTDGWQELYEAKAAFTPSLTFATPGNLSVAYSTRTGRYERHGHQVTVSIQIQTSSFTHTTASGALRITGLPFTVKNTSNVDWVGQIIWSGITKATYTSIAARASANGTIVDFVASGSGVGVSAVAAADMPTGGTVFLQFTITYEI